MIELAQHDGDYLAICKYYKAVFDTPLVQEDAAKHNEVSSAVLLGALECVLKWGGLNANM